MPIPYSSTIHPQTTIRYHGREAQVDAAIAPLIRNLWKLGFDTLNSCQDNNSTVWIEFALVSDGELFLDTILKYEEGIEGLYNRARKMWEPEDWQAFRARSWQYAVLPWDDNVEQELTEDDEIDEHPVGPQCNFRFSLSVRFPREDLPEVEKRVARAVRQQARRAQ